MLFIFGLLYSCVVNEDCGVYGLCLEKKNGQLNATYSCECAPGIISVDGKCNYQQESKLNSFLVSLFVGGLGVDRCLISRGNGGYICLGIFKAITGGGLGIWWLIDWILILTDNLKDGNGQKIREDWK